MHLDVYMNRWIVGDGNYSDFSEGEKREFALEFWADDTLAASPNREKSILATGSYLYAINAQVVCSSAEILVIDFGLLAYSDAPGELQRVFKAGDFVAGRIGLGVDPFFYFESLWELPEVPPLIYEWQIESIEQETTPLVLSDIGGRSGWVRDKTRTGFATVHSTSQVIPNPNDIAPNYVLHCAKLETPAVKQFSRPQIW